METPIIFSFDLFKDYTILVVPPLPLAVLKTLFPLFFFFLARVLLIFKIFLENQFLAFLAF